MYAAGLSPIWKIIGGGDQVTTALAFVIISDISSEEELSVYHQSIAGIFPTQLTLPQIDNSISLVSLLFDCGSAGHSVQRLPDDAQSLVTIPPWIRDNIFWLPSFLACP